VRTQLQQRAAAAAAEQLGEAVVEHELTLNCDSSSSTAISNADADIAQCSDDHSMQHSQSNAVSQRVSDQHAAVLGDEPCDSSNSNDDAASVQSVVPKQQQQQQRQQWQMNNVQLQCWLW
jgi:hypothetical protein